MDQHPTLHEVDVDQLSPHRQERAGSKVVGHPCSLVPSHHLCKGLDLKPDLGLCKELMIVPNRGAFREHLRRGSFGNSLREWKSLEELGQSDYRGPVTLRHKHGSAIFVRYGVLFAELEQAVRDSGHSREHLWANESAPDHRILFQGEAERGPRGWVLFISRLRAPMRKALLEARHFYGLAALNSMRYGFTESSLADFEALHEQFPDSVIEFTCFDICVGNIPGRNVVIWEVRNY